MTDLAARTCRISTGIEYTQLLPIQALGGAIVRPESAGDGQVACDGMCA